MTETTPALPAPVAARVATRVAYWQAPENDPEGDCRPELAEAMALQDICETELARLERKVGACGVEDRAKLRALACALAAL